jgi:PiT family inorganic phosphate transporter
LRFLIGRRNRKSEIGNRKSKMTTSLFWMVIALVGLFALTNGFLDGGGIVSTVVTTRTLHPLSALALVALCEVGGLFLLGRAVAQTVGMHLLAFPGHASPERILLVLACSVVGALGWNTLMWRLSIPSSSSHALIGGLLGASLAGLGTAAVRWPVAITVLLFLGAGPWMAAGTSLLLLKAVRWAGGWLYPSVIGVVRRTQATILAGLAMAHGSMDGQKSLAIMWMAYAACQAGSGAAHSVPPYYAGLCGGALALGVILGSHRTLETLGCRLYRVHNLQSLCAETTAMALVGASSILGWPMASSHVMSSAVVGAGAAVHPKDVRWSSASGIALAWLSTIPAAAAISAALFLLARHLFHVVS